MKKTSLLKYICLIFSVLTLFNSAIPVFAASSDTVAYNWYTKRNDTHTLSPLDNNLKFITEYNAVYGDTKASEQGDKVIYLTFDAGYENGNVEKILDVLKEKNVSGAFFILTYLVKNNTELVKRMSDEGHLVCNHTSTHSDMSQKTDIESFKSELEALESVYNEYTGKTLSKYFRPPEGRFSLDSMRYANELGYKTIFWSFAYADWDNNDQMSPQAAKQKILDNIHNGAILLLHPTSATNAAILGDIIDELRTQGYTFGTLNDLTA